MITEKNLLHLTETYGSRLKTKVTKEAVIPGECVGIHIKFEFITGKDLLQDGNGEDQKEHGKDKTQQKAAKEQQKVDQGKTGFNAQKNLSFAFMQVVIQCSVLFQK